MIMGRLWKVRGVGTSVFKSVRRCGIGIPAPLTPDLPAANRSFFIGYVNPTLKEEIGPWAVEVK